MKRWACLADLENYFKRSDLLKGLTEPEKELLRINIGASSALSINEVEEVTYSQLLDKKTRGTLISGKHYKLTDFLTIYLSNHLVNGIYETWGSSINPSTPYTLILTAITSGELDKKVTILEHPDWSAEYSIKKETLHDGRTTKGKITYLRDSNNNIAFYDFKNVKFARIENNIQVNYYTFSNKNADLTIGDASELEETYNNYLSPGCWNNVFLGDTYNNKFESDCVSNTFYKGCHDCHFNWETSSNTFKVKVAYLSGTVGGKYFPTWYKLLETSLTKLIHIVEDATVITYLDTVTYSQQISIVKDYEED